MNSFRRYSRRRAEYRKLHRSSHVREISGMIDEKVKKAAPGAKQFEVRQEIFFEPKQKHVRYRIETYMFSPVSLQINQENYKPADCLHLFKNYIRLRAPSIPLEELNEESDVSKRIDQAFEYYASPYADDEGQFFISATKLYALTFKRSIRVKVRNLMQQKEVSADDITSFSYSLHQALDVYRSRMKKFRAVGEKLNSESDMFCDEFMSTSTLYYLQKLYAAVEDESVKAFIKSIWNQEYVYREKHHPESTRRGELGPERTLYRWRILSRYVGSYLFLNIKPRSGSSMVLHSLYGVAAAVSMIFATLIAFIWQEKYGSLSSNLFLAMVIGYIFKDRIKDLLKENLAKRFRKWIPDRRLQILRDDKYHVGDCRESYSFFKEKDLPQSIRALRQQAQSVKGVYDWRFENILLYKKEMSIRTDASLFSDARYALLDTTWFNISPFLTFVDASQDDLPVASPEDLTVRQAEKIYHLYFVRRLQGVRDRGEETIKEEVIRVVINHEGIKRIQLLDGQ